MTLNPVDEAFRARMRATLPEAAFRDPDPVFLEEPRGRRRGRAGLILAPGTASEAQVIIRAAAEARIAVIPHGGGTGLVGGQLADDLPDPLVVSMSRMTSIRDVFPDELVLVAESGATLAAIQDAAKEAGLLFPLSYGSEGTARIGGALAVNSGGLNVIRYGTARDLCLGLEAVMPDGSLWHGLRRLRKDNTGYDLRGLMIGSEGTLGLITAAILRLYPRPDRTATALLSVPGPNAALSLLSRARKLAGETVSAFELISGQGPAMVAETGIPARIPFDPFPDWAVLIEIAATHADPAEMMETLFEEASNAEEVSDGVIASSEDQRADLWRLREAIPEANRKVGAVASHDISLPLGAVPEFLELGPARLAEIAPVRINVFGHLGDGNLHYNCFPRPGETRNQYDDVRDAITRAVHDLAVGMGGSFSAEHGIGRLKTGELRRHGDPAKRAAMLAIKQALDPAGIMNPGAVFGSA